MKLISNVHNKLLTNKMLKQLEQDAARYRFLRNFSASSCLGVYFEDENSDPCHYLAGESLDAEIDNAMLKSTETK